MMELQKRLAELFEQSAAKGRYVLEITGDDIASFADEVIKKAQTYTT